MRFQAFILGLFVLLGLLGTLPATASVHQQKKANSHFSTSQNGPGKLKGKRKWLMKLQEKFRRTDAAPVNKGTAIALAVALGPFGVHRLYLGTEPQIPVFYTLTLGGGLGLLPVTDIIVIIITPDLEHFRNKDSFIMWGDFKFLE